MDVVIVRENEEDLYAGIEHRQTDEVYQCLKLITRPGCERIVRHAFEYARSHGRRKVTCMVKDNIMKMTDGLFRKVATEIAAEYPEIEFEHWIVDIGTAKLADAPGQFDVILLPNLYGDIISDVAAEIAGSVGLAGSANIGTNCAMFEAIHGSAPLIAGKGIANPSGLLLAAVQMLVHIGQGDVATTVHNAWLRTIEDGVHTEDVYDTSNSKRKVGTADFASAVIDRLGQEPGTLKPVRYSTATTISVKMRPHVRQKKEQVGIDVFLDEPNRTPDQLGKVLEQLANPDFRLDMLSNRGQKVYPDGAPETLCVDAFRCRFIGNGTRVTVDQVLALLARLAAAGHHFVKSEGLFTFDGEPGFTKGQGQ